MPDQPTCRRTACANVATHRHRQTGDLYCLPCARRINHHNPGLVVPLGNSHTPEPVCPHCRAEMTDVWDLNLEEGSPLEVECGSCGKTYTVVKNVKITYSTEP